MPPNRYYFCPTSRLGIAVPAYRQAGSHALHSYSHSTHISLRKPIFKNFGQDYIEMNGGSYYKAQKKIFQQKLALQIIILVGHISLKEKKEKDLIVQKKILLYLFHFRYT